MFSPDKCRAGVLLTGLCLVLTSGHARGSTSASTDPLDAYNVRWESPSHDHNGSMPIGNGDIGANVWIDPAGDLWLLLGKTDAWSENGRLLKLGRVRVRLSPNPFADHRQFAQTLRLRQGEIAIEAGVGDQAVKLTVWIDAYAPAIYIEVQGAEPLKIQVLLDLWRTTTRELTGKELNSAYGLQGAPFGVTVQPDTVVAGPGDSIIWHHRNTSSIWENNLVHQGLGGFLDRATDPLLGRTFGGSIGGDGLFKVAPNRLESRAPSRQFTLAIVPHAARTESAEAWVDQLNRRAATCRARDLHAARRLHRAWWRAFWDRSWIRISGTPDAEVITRGYTLQRWITACAGRGAFPIKFNGSIFTVDGDGYDADYRAWGGPYWWQNTRLVYWPMLACGDFDLMQPLFSMYRAMLPLAEYRTRTWYGHDGAFIGETVYFWGMYNNNNYGWARAPDLPVGELTNPYIRREYTAALELLALMLDTYAYTGESGFLQEALLPTCDSLLTFWDRHYATHLDGRMILYPAQALETLQDAENPTPDVAGLHWVLRGLLALPSRETGPERRAFWRRLAGKVPPLPLTATDGQTVIAGAAKVYGGRGNSENPELYAIFPFRIYGVGKPDLEVGRRTFEVRSVKGHNGWRQDDTQAAFLGLTETAADAVADRAGTKHSASRFPAFWGPNFDWIPDQDHGGNLMMALQTMLLQADEGWIRLLPAWPRSWNVDFKLHAPQRTVVEGRLEDGKLVQLKVDPPSRRRDVILEIPFSEAHMPNLSQGNHAQPSEQPPTGAP